MTMTSPAASQLNSDLLEAFSNKYFFNISCHIWEPELDKIPIMYISASL